MAKFALVFLLVVTLAVAGFAREPVFLRTLQQANNSVKSGFTCTQAKQLQGDGCGALLRCLTTSREMQSLATPNNLKLFETSCKACANAAKNCPSDDSLPGPCKLGLSIAPIMTCAQQLASSAAGTTAATAAKAGN